MRKIALTLVMVIALSTITGCVAEIRTPPPPARVEVRPVAPFPDAVWIDGYWDFRHGGWVWIDGYWERRPRHGAVWVPGHWKETPRGWRWIPGYWR
ncbi:MAG: hypothetical protein OHK0032_13410 [Thermodesulfovibrionales bacterium]